jgi:hypothetical protein
MLSLEDQRWSELRHAYGTAGDVPALLRQLESMPSSGGNAEPWFTLWSSLAHQDDVYPASFAAVPHIIRVLASAPTRADHSYFQFPAWVEICRVRNNVDIPEELRSSYFESLAQLPSLVAEASTRPWDSGFLRCTLAALAAAKGHPLIAKAALELTPEVAEEFLDWLYEQ